MPGYKKHLLYSIPILIVILLYFPMDITRTLLAIPLFFLYTLLPDTDTPASKIRKIVEVSLLISILILLIVFNQIITASVLIVILILLWSIKHRGILHSPITGFLLAYPALSNNIEIGIICYIGFITHLILDKFLKN